jgi:glycosyltransferase involved in cell wall biosynthesis
MPLRAAHQHQIDADALLLITAPGQRSVATLKLFDYIGAGVPILALAENNAAAEIVSRYGLGVTARPNDPAAILAALGDLASRRRAGETWPGFAAAQRDFEWRSLTGQLAALFDKVLSR